MKEHAREGTLIPLRQIVNSRSPQGLFVFGSEERVQLAYAESWILFHWLMQPQQRNRFFNYVRYVRDIKHMDELALQPRLEILAEAMGLSVAQFNRRWHTYVERL